MDPIFRKCLTAITHINEELLPKMGQAYNQLIDRERDSIISNQCLNDARKYSKAAIEAKNSGLIDNSNAKKYLNSLDYIDQKLDNRSRNLNDLLNEIKSKFTKRSKDIVQKNHNYLTEMKTGDTPAKELLIMIVNLGKDVQKVINEEVPAYKKEIDFYIKKTEDMICDDAYWNYKKIIELDEGTLPNLKAREWVYLPYELFRTSGAFLHQSYEI